MVKEVSDTTKYDWDRVFNMPVMEFLSIVCFTRDYNNYDLNKAKGVWAR